MAEVSKKNVDSKYTVGVSTRVCSMDMRGYFFQVFFFSWKKYPLMFMGQARIFFSRKKKKLKKKIQACLGTSVEFFSIFFLFGVFPRKSPEHAWELYHSNQNRKFEVSWVYSPSYARFHFPLELSNSMLFYSFSILWTGSLFYLCPHRQVTYSF